ncbi:hypothetical protein [Prosthecobacter sp.]|uniref:hypothetical protein n=1 Tax=Prosthecobacter sp. TaxID=1965333 RepID=UPI0037843C19
MTFLAQASVYALQIVLLALVMRLIFLHCRVAFQEKRAPALARIKRKGGRG